MLHRFLKIHPNDNVLVALTDLKKGDTVEYDGSRIVLADDVQAKHKFAQRPLAAGEEILMYGSLVGKAVYDIPVGGVLTTANVKHQVNGFTGKTKTIGWQAPDVSKWANRTFMGYHRPDGQVGTGNYWLVIPLVFCENRNVDIIKQAFLDELGFGQRDVYKSYVQQMVELYQTGNTQAIETLALQKTAAPVQRRIFENVDGIKFLTHEGGCGGTRQDSDMLCALLADYIHHPNVAGATVLSLGCQNAQVSILESKLQALDPNFSKPVIVLEQQKEGTEEEMMSKAIRQTFLALIEADKLKRAPAPLSKLSIGLECGGSDGFSGISANPAIGHTSDILVALGGKTVLSEFPELCGVEQELINRCESNKAAERFASLMRAYAASAEAVGSGFDMNPSPGNIRDGLITDAIKSAGAAKKGGTSPIVDVLDYPEYATKPGLNLLCTPGNDVECTTALVGAGTNIVLFTTGLGTPTGNPIAPVIKISSNTKLAQRMPDIIDIDTGAVISGEKTIEQMGEDVLDFIIEVASGRIETKEKILQQDDFIPWKRGVSL
ncbi:UxaA family hydrolase [Rufibacter sediminis]|uniref:Altronate dehydratase n=1 Tax=Rufibacter sediminis TaxID=2762756 RepID=A0ABR6VWY2_9BACT|nr:altronate dehydratase family protein [Rufibacter sediminis]MBC3541161.1 altronate dehydratase [Rufibacter sediminis]